MGGWSRTGVPPEQVKGEDVSGSRKKKKGKILKKKERINYSAAKKRNERDGKSKQPSYQENWR